MNWKLSIARSLKTIFLPLVIVTSFVALVGGGLGIWVGNPVGDDAYTHVGKVLFLLRNFPNVNWYPYWYLGFDVFRGYPATFYIVLAITHILTRVSVPSIMVAYFFLSMVLLGVGIYEFSRLLYLPRSISVGLAIMTLLFPVSWAWTVTGGAYIRSFALPFFIVSISIAYYHTVRINSGKDDLRLSFAAASVLAFTILLHQMVAFFTFITTILFYGLAVRGMKQKMKTLFRVFIPVCGLVAWTYLPMFEDFITSEEAMINEISYESIERLLIIYNPVLVPLVLTSVVAFCLVLKKHKPSMSKERSAVVLVFLVLSLYFFLFGWVPMPRSLYIMAAYDYRNWLGFSLSMFLIGVLGLLYDFFEPHPPKLRLPALRRYERLFNYFLVVSLVVAVSTALVVSLPELVVYNVNPGDPQSFIYYFRNDVDQIVKQLPENYRLAFITRRIFAFQYLVFPNLEATGGRQVGQLHPFYNSIFSERVFYRYFGEAEKYYSEEQPAMRSKVPYMESNFYSSMFWLDWFGARGVIIGPWEAHTVTFHEYTLRPQFFEIFESGDTIFAKYGDSSPITVSPDAPTLGIVVSGNSDEQFYSEALIILGEINLNSQSVIPLKLTTADLNKNLQFVNNLLVSPAIYADHKTLLDDYASNGGHLIIMNYGYSGSEMKFAESTSLGFHFLTYATPLSGFPVDSEVLAKTTDGSVAYRLRVGKGTVTRSAVSIQELYETATPDASLSFAETLGPDLSPSRTKPMDNSWYVRDSEGVAETSIEQTGNGESSLSYRQAVSQSHSRIEFATLLEEETSASANGVIQFELWNDGEIPYIEISQVDAKNQGYLNYTLSNSAWNGWKMFSIPLASFTRRPDVELATEFNGLALTCVDDEPSSASDHTLRVRDLSLYKFEQTHSYTALSGRWIHPNQYEVSTSDGILNLLWKEAYVNDWRIETTPSSVAEYYYAGPGVIFARFPQTVESVTFLKPLSDSQRVGILISLLMLPSLLVLYIYAGKSAQPHKVKRVEAL